MSNWDQLRDCYWFRFPFVCLLSVGETRWEREDACKAIFARVGSLTFVRNARPTCDKPFAVSCNTVSFFLFLCVRALVLLYLWKAAFWSLQYSSSKHSLQRTGINSFWKFWNRDGGNQPFQRLYEEMMVILWQYFGCLHVLTTAFGIGVR